MAIVSSVVGLSCIANAGERLVLATGQQQATAHHAGIGIASLIRVKLGPEHKIDLQAVPSSGPVSNVDLMKRGYADLAILPSATGHAMRAATGSFAGQPPDNGLRAIAALWLDALHLVIRDDDASSGTIDDFLNLDGQRVFLGGKGTGAIDAIHLLVSELGVDINRSFDAESLPDDPDHPGGIDRNAVNAMVQGNLDALSVLSTPPSPLFSDLSAADVARLKFLDITSDQMRTANGSHWLWTPYTIPAATYPGQNNDIATIALSNLLVINADISAETAYLVTKSIFENLPYLHRVVPSLADLSMNRALFGVSLPLHPGALRYFKEAGIIPRTSVPRAPVKDEGPSDHDATGYPNADVASNEMKIFRVALQ